jgi:hypothetical protein
MTLSQSLVYIGTLAVLCCLLLHALKRASVIKFLLALAGAGLIILGYIFFGMYDAEVVRAMLTAAAIALVATMQFFDDMRRSTPSICGGDA